MLPLTKDTTKCLLEINKKPLLARQVEILGKTGIKTKDIIVVTGHFAEKVESLCRKLDVQTQLNPFFEVSGMAMSIWVAKSYLNQDTLLLYSDLLFDPKIAENIMKAKGDICIAVDKDSDRVEAEKIVEKSGNVRSILKSDACQDGEFIGITKLSRKGAVVLADGLEDMAKKNKDASLKDVLNNIIESGNKIKAVDIKGKKYLDIDFPDDMEIAEKFSY
jgi:choline kinase